jgi:hypothetical protein
MRTTRPLVQRFLRFLLTSSLVVLVVGITVQAPRATVGDSQDAPAGRCTIQNVAGSYGFLGTGTNLPNPVGFPETLIATVGILTLDGQGNWVTTNHSLTLNGQATTMVSLSGTYMVNPDCTYTFRDMWLDASHIMAHYTVLTSL